MSRRINKLNQNNSYKRATIPTYSSTPKNGLVMLHHCSISLSDINTASSSSGGRRNLLLQMQGKELLCMLNYILVNSFR